MISTLAIVGSWIAVMHSHRVTNLLGPWITVCLVTTMAIVAGCGGARAQVPQRVENVRLSVDGVDREYFLYSPALAPRRDAYVMLFLHGGGGTPQQVMRELGPELFAMADTSGVHVVIPQAIDKLWDFGGGRISRELDRDVHDRGYFAAMFRDLEQKLPLARRGVFATGISRGGHASWFLACEFPDRVRAIAPVAMPLPAYLETRCAEGPPVGVMIINGTEDPIVPYNGGTITIGRRQRDEVLSTPATVELWRARNGCAGEPSQQARVDAARDRTNIDISEWRDCAGDPVVLYKVNGGGHTWPSGRSLLPRFLVGRTTRDINGVDTVAEFFAEFQ